MSKITDNNHEMVAYGFRKVHEQTKEIFDDRQRNAAIGAIRRAVKQYFKDAEAHNDVVPDTAQFSRMCGFRVRIKRKEKI